MSTTTITLECDELDAATINAAIADWQVRTRWASGSVMLPDGEGNLAGRIVAELIRGLNEYREMYDSEHQ